MVTNVEYMLFSLYCLCVEYLVFVEYLVKFLKTTINGNCVAMIFWGNEKITELKLIKHCFYVYKPLQ